MAERTLPGLGLTGFWDLGADGWKAGMDTNLLLLSALVQPRAISLVATEPVAPSNGDVYLLNETNATNPNALALYDDSGWVYLPPSSGWVVYDISAGVRRQFTGTAWDEIPTGAATFTPASATDVWSGEDQTKVLTPKSLFDSAAAQVLTDAPTIVMDLASGLNFEVTLSANRALANPTNAKPGQSGTVVVKQDGSGSRTLSFGSNWRFPGGAATGGVVSSAPNSIDLIAFIVQADATVLATLTKAFAA
ncbi:DUF2793 domain-containing protein [Novosphingobium sp. YJ-S2-02]|uniref:DUF2793 domain-containing protein n=1 Tax=Novosphingobium aureum TaxID=2792964 RepID=A0A931HC25_9SPHN|nr:DUF2793 domain-containing protein [Novosphingobium aureum]MBH0113255.1 DUF2793 domain-containing protein [Novosphingobium aureum]